MTTDFRHTWLSPSQSPCPYPNNTLLCWERCVKRKCNDGSGQLLHGYNVAKTEGGSRTLSCDAAWCSMPSISDGHKTSVALRTSSNIGSLQDKQCDRGYNLASKSTDRALQPPHIQISKKDDVSKKRIHTATSAKTLHGGIQACETAAEREVLRLKEALKLEKSALRRLYKDLEEERCASAMAANEAMAMIRRIQAEKAAALIESQQFKRVSEEREAYNQDVIALLKDTLSIKEQELFYLQNHIEDHRNILRKMKSGQGLIQMIESNHLEGNKENAQLLLFEGKETALCALMESNYLEEVLNEECDTGDRARSESTCWHHYPLEESILEGRRGLAKMQSENYRSDTVFEQQDFDDVSMSILARVASLEERFACLGQNEALDPEGGDLTPHNIPENASFLGCGKIDPPPMHNNRLNSVKFNIGLVADNSEDLEDVKCPVFERVATNSECRNQEHSYSAPFEQRGSTLNEMKSKEIPIGLHKASPDQGHSYSEIVDAASDGIHSVYEVQCRLDGSARSYSDCINGSHESEYGGRDFLSTDSTEVLEDKMDDGSTSVYGRRLSFYDGLAGCDVSMTDKVGAEMSSAGCEAIKSSVAAKDLHHLKIRLQALEGERVFMNEAIEALRKENVELRLLQEIAHQLQELKGSHCHDQLPFLSFFKRILSFAGLQSLTCTDKTRFFYRCQGSIQTSSNKLDYGGLHHLLNNSLQEEKNLCVTRERKVKLDTT